MAENLSNPIIEVYKNRPVRRYNTIYIIADPIEFKHIIDATFYLKLSLSDAVKRTSLFCKQNNINNK